MVRDEELCFKTVAELGRLIHRGEVSPVDLARAFIERARRLDGAINAYITLADEQALEAAKVAQQAIAAGAYLGPLHGIPVAVKDAFDTAGIRTTVGSKLLLNNIPTTDATAVRRLKEAGAVILGKTNLHEFCFGVTNNNRYFGATRNPWDRERVPGGSSGGSAAAVSASFCAAALGTDTGGSIRIPASACGVVGLKSTYGRVSRSGVFPLSWSLDHAGPLTKSVEDAAIMLSALAGYDPADPTSSRVPAPNYSERLDSGVHGVKVGVPREFFFQGLDPEVAAAVEEAIIVIKGLSADVRDVSVPNLDLARSIYNSIVMPEAYLYHREWLNSSGEEYDPDVRGRLELGAFITAAEYLQGQRARNMLIEHFKAVLSDVDILLTPTLCIPAPKIEQEVVRIGDLQVDVRGALIRFTSPINITGLPVLSIPCGMTLAGLPVGLQLIGRPFDEATVLKLGHAYEQATEWHKKRPAL